MKYLLFFSLLAANALGDTITFIDGSFVNAKVTLDGKAFHLAGQVKGSNYTFPDISSDIVKTIRFNSLVNNAEPPPEFAQPRAASLKPILCEVTLERGDSNRGVLEAINDNDIKMDGKSRPKDAIKVLRIVH